MTNREAFNWFKNWRDLINELSEEAKQSESAKDMLDAYDIAIEAIFNQLPLKPIIRSNGFEYCRLCGHSILNAEYCPECGKKIDWLKQEVK